MIALMMEAVRTSVTSDNFNVTAQRYIPEDSKLHTHRRENLKSHMATTNLPSKSVLSFNDDLPADKVSLRKQRL
jgi:hypothetical protein